MTYTGFWDIYSLATDINGSDLYVLDISNVYYGDSISDGSFILFLSSSYDPRDREKYYTWAEDSNAILLYISSGSLYTGSADYITPRTSGRLVYNVSASEATLGKCKVGYMLPEGMGVISDRDGLVSNISDLLCSGSSGSMVVNLYGSHEMPIKTMLCRAPSGKCNASTNPTFYKSGSGGIMHLSGSGNATIITKIGFYDENMDLVGVATLAHPVIKNVDDDILFKVRIDM